MQDEKTTKARKRAKNDARTALRKLRDWADEQSDFETATQLSLMLSEVARISERLELGESQ